MPAVGLTTVAVMTVVGPPIQWEFAAPWQALVPTFFMILLLNALPEEYGWRGYALGPLLDRSSALTTSLILGLLWGLWHLPLHFIEGTVQSAIPVYQFLIQQMVLAILFTWLFTNTRGAVPVAMLFHAVANIVGAAVPYWTTDLALDQSCCPGRICGSDPPDLGTATPQSASAGRIQACAGGKA